MAQASKRLKRQRKLKRNLSKSNRFGKIMSSKLMEANQLLLGVLAQSGGEVTLTTGTLEQIVENFSDLAWVVEKGRAKNELVVKMVSNGMTAADKDRMTPAGPNPDIQRVGEAVV